MASNSQVGGCPEKLFDWSLAACINPEKVARNEKWLGTTFVSAVHGVTLTHVSRAISVREKWRGTHWIRSKAEQSLHYSKDLLSKGQGVRGHENYLWFSLVRCLTPARIWGCPSLAGLLGTVLEYLLLSGMRVLHPHGELGYCPSTSSIPDAWNTKRSSSSMFKNLYDQRQVICCDLKGKSEQDLKDLLA